jgi:hypothetical protein
MRVSTLAFLTHVPIVVGIGLFIQGQSLPPYSDDAEAQRVFVSVASYGAQCASAGWYEAMDALRTARYPLMDLGRGLALFGLTMLAVSGVFALQGARRLADLRTPAETPLYFASGMAIVLLWSFATAWSYALELPRQYLPSCADSVGIPMFESLYFGAIVLILALITGGILSRFFGMLPVSLWIWDKARPVRSWSWTIACALLVALLLLLLVDAVTTEFFLTTPFLLVGIWLTLATRAALLAPSYEQDWPPREACSGLTRSAVARE